MLGKRRVCERVLAANELVSLPDLFHVLKSTNKMENKYQASAGEVMSRQRRKKEREKISDFPLHDYLGGTRESTYESLMIY